jgi:RNA polymerase sigma-32 factor
MAEPEKTPCLTLTIRIKEERQTMINERFAEDRIETGDGADQNLPMPFDPLKTYLAEVSKHPVLSREEEFRLATLVRENEDRDAAQKLVISNLRLVVKISLEYYNTYLNILDLIQEGNVGVLHAVRKYDPHKGTKFSTYASFWIRAYILKYIMDSWSIVKVGTTQGQRRLFYSLNKEKQRLESLGIRPEPKLLAEGLGVKEHEVAEMQQRLACTDISLETPIHVESDDTVMDTISSDENVEEIICQKQESEIASRQIKEFKNTLNDKEIFIFDHRVLSEEPKTLQEIGMKFRISRERVRQIEGRVIVKLKERLTEAHRAPHHPRPHATEMRA